MFLQTDLASYAAREYIYFMGSAIYKVNTPFLIIFSSRYNSKKEQFELQQKALEAFFKCQRR